MTLPLQIQFIAAVLDVFHGCEPGTRRWFNEPDFDVYLRKGAREFHGTRHYALTLADVTVKESARGCGVFSDLLLDVECCAMLLGCTAVYVENLRPELVNALARRGYQVKLYESGQFDMLKSLTV